MKFRPLAIAACLAGLIALPSLAEAAPGRATGSVNLRAGPGVNYARITTVPAGAKLNVHGCKAWCNVTFRGIRGWVSASYVAWGAPRYRYAAPVYRAVPPPPPPYYGYGYGYPGPYYYRPYRPYYAPGFSFGFGFRG
jgi:uncharacterized protein YraI